MYQSGSNGGLVASRVTLPQESHWFLHDSNVSEHAGLVLSTDAKPRLKWTPELHERFVESVNQLGGADKATPKTLMRLMGIPGLTLYHLKSHLQKYRLSKNLQAHAVGSSKQHERESTALLYNVNPFSQANKSLQISEALQMQIEVQQRLHEQLEVQRHLQLRIEAQGKYLQTVLEKARETLSKQDLSSTTALEATEMQCYEEASRDSCLTDHMHKGPEDIGLAVAPPSHALSVNYTPTLNTPCGGDRVRVDRHHQLDLNSQGGDADVLTAGLRPFDLNGLSLS